MDLTRGVTFRSTNPGAAMGLWDGRSPPRT